MKIFFSGGGTLGPVTPLLALHETLQAHDPSATFFWVGTTRGPERAVVEAVGIPFVTLSSGKFRRYISIWNVVDIARIGIGFVQSFLLLWKHNPDLCISAGGYISVPLHAAAWILGIPTWVHQQDIDTGLANSLMTPLASKITTAMESQTAQFSKRKVLWLGNPVRRALFRGNVEWFRERFQIPAGEKIVFVTGGGTGSMKVNQMTTSAVQHLAGFAHVVHLSGLERPQELVERAEKFFSYYHTVQFFNAQEMADAYAAADIVVSRGGFGTIAELAALKKCAILIPKPGHQEDNVKFLFEANAAQFVDEQLSDGNFLAKTIRQLLEDTTGRQRMGERLHTLLPQAQERIVVQIVERLVR